MGAREAVRGGVNDAPLVMAPPSHDDSEVQTIGENAFASLLSSFARQVVAGDIDRAEPRQTAVVRIELSLKETPEALAHWSLFRRDAGPLGVELATVAEIRPTVILSLCNGVFMVDARRPSAARSSRLSCAPRTAEHARVRGVRGADAVGARPPTRVDDAPPMLAACQSALASST